MGRGVSSVCMKWLEIRERPIKCQERVRVSSGTLTLSVSRSDLPNSLCVYCLSSHACCVPCHDHKLHFHSRSDVKCRMKQFPLSACVPTFNLCSVSGFPGSQPQMFLERISTGSDAAAGISRLRRSRGFAGHRQRLRVGSRSRRLGQECSEAPK
jgi:hypothetical protein